MEPSSVVVVDVVAVAIAIVVVVVEGELDGLAVGCGGVADHGWREGWVLVWVFVWVLVIGDGALWKMVSVLWMLWMLSLSFACGCCWMLGGVFHIIGILFYFVVDCYMAVAVELLKITIL